MKQSEHDSAIRAISALYADEGQVNKNIAILEEVKPRMENSAVLHELLGNLYKKVGDTDKAEIAYTKWLQIRQKTLNRQQSTLHSALLISNFRYLFLKPAWSLH